METGEAAASRYPIPDGLQRGALALGKWMRIVGIFQAVACAMAVLFSAIGLLGMISMIGPFNLPVFVSVVLIGILAICFRQGLALQSAADHLVDISSEPDDAHDHLSLAFSRLVSVFAIDIVVATLLFVRNALWAVVA